jgi:putative NADH-flavin reductase
MKLLILGATGGIGIELVRQALGRGHRITAFVRTPDRLREFGNRIRIVTGDPLKVSELAPAIHTHDAVLSAFGPRVPIAKSDEHLLSAFAKSLTSAMQAAQVKRGILVSTAFLFRDAWLPPAYLFGRLLFPGVVRDASEMEAILGASNLDLVIVRPPQLTDKPHTGRFRVRQGRLPILGLSVPRADVADCMIQQAEGGEFRNMVLGVAS